MSDDCKFCTEEKEIRQNGRRKGDFKIEIWKNDSQDLDDEFYLNIQHSNQNIYEEDFRINYCPICGRKLNDQGEAEKMEVYENKDRECECFKCEIVEKCIYRTKYQRLPSDLYPGALNKCPKLPENKGKLQY
ncbi:MAG: hypothetical protein CVU99_16255 [Firmicutes bacterium HGW-Firmicutes-4]|nr:MAG: hypothetical protein CVU99_16255 [Firmicutes bacterium HGW-Firmicutes-4]